MSKTTTVRVSRATHEELRQVAQRRQLTLAETVAQAVRLLRQDELGRDLASPLTAEETSWLDADTG